MLNKHQSALDDRHASSNCFTDVAFLQTEGKTLPRFQLALLQHLLYYGGLEPNPQNLQGTPVLRLEHNLELFLWSCSAWLRGLMKLSWNWTLLSLGASLIWEWHILSLLFLHWELTPRITTKNVLSHVQIL